MNVLFIDMDGCCLDIALRAQAYHHNVRLFIGPDKHTGERVCFGDGLIKRINQWETSVNWADLIFVADNAKYLHGLEGLRSRGYPIFGPNKEMARWELDRAYGQHIFEQAGIDVIPSQSFTKYSEARAYVVKNKKRLVSKPNGDVCKALSYVSHSAKDMCFMLDKWHKEGKMKDEFILQDFIPGIEMAVGGFFGPNGFASCYMENFEHKKLMNDDKGVNTGEMGTVLKYVTQSKLADEVLLPLAPALHRAGHTGYIDVSVIIDKSGKPWPMEFTSRPGWPLDQIRLALEDLDPIQWMLDLLNGKDTFKPSSDVAVGVVVTMPDFPYDHITNRDNCGYPVYGLNESNIQNIHLAQCMLGEAPGDNPTMANEEMIVTAGAYVYVATGTGKTISQAKDKAYKTIDSVELPNSPGYRTDIGCRLEEEIPKLQKYGYATDWKF